jgi:hypothetical protein
VDDSPLGEPPPESILPRRSRPTGPDSGSLVATLSPGQLADGAVRLDAEDASSGADSTSASSGGHHV